MVSLESIKTGPVIWACDEDDRNQFDFNSTGRTFRRVTERCVDHLTMKVSGRYGRSWGWVVSPVGTSGQISRRRRLSRLSDMAPWPLWLVPESIAGRAPAPRLVWGNRERTRGSYRRLGRAFVADSSGRGARGTGKGV